ncbi:MAG: type IV secretory system conjugative DNA transfer family protein, partial [Nitrospirota bacterium]
MKIFEERRRLITDEMEAGCGSAEVLPRPVPLEPPFKPFGRRPEENCEHTGLPVSSSGRLCFIRIKPSREDKSGPEIAEQFILSLRGNGPFAFEIIGNGGKIGFQITVNENLVNAVISQAGSHFPYADIYESDDLIGQAMTPHAVSRAYRLRNTHFLPLQLIMEGDPYRTLFGCLGNLGSGRLGALQILFAPVTNDWQDNMRRASRNPYDQTQSPFIDLPQLPKSVDKKLAKPLFAASIRILASDTACLEELETFLKQSEGTDNGIVPVPGIYPIESVLKRNTFVHGSILNLAEISYFLHLPAQELLESMPFIERAAKSYPVPEEYTLEGPVLGYNLHRGKRKAVRHSPTLPNRHVYSPGGSGNGKSNLILHAAVQRIERGDGIAVIDPHGSLIQGLLLRIPKERIDDVIYFNAGDFQYPISINPLAHNGTKLEKEHIRVDLLNFFEDLFEAPLGVNIQHTLNFLIITLLTRRDSTIQDIERLLIDKSWRAGVMQTIEDDRIRLFWEQEYPALEKRGIVTAIANKLSPLILPDSAIAPMLKQRENRIDFLEVMNSKKIFLCNLSHGDIGKRNSQLLGKLLVSKLQIAAMMREGMESYPDYYLFIDEFQHMACPSMADILSGARKYGLHLWLANQMTEDIPDSILRHVFNASTFIFFATDSPHDRMLIEKTLSKKFTAEDIGQLKKGETFVKMAGSTFNMVTERMPEPTPDQWVDEIISLSR